MLLGERVYVMAPRPGRIHKEYNRPFAEMGLTQDLREIKKNNLMINYLARDEDKYCWQFSNKGYFNFKSNIPKILSQFKLN